MKKTEESADGVTTFLISRCRNAVVIMGVFALYLFGIPAFGGEALDRAIVLDIPAETSLENALIEWGLQAGMTVMCDTRTVDSLVTLEVKGTLTARDALSKILQGTGLSYRRNGNNIQIVAHGSLTTSALHELVQPPPAITDGSGSADNAEDASRSRQGQKSDGLDEVVVTAQKRSEKLIDVPVAISVVGGERMEQLQVNSLADLADFVPGMSIMDGGAPGNRTVIIRGLNTSYYNDVSATLVATYIDDLPVGSSSTDATGGRFGLDLQPYDLDRVEVLKGPQGTLYGSDAMGGLIKYVLKKPDLNNFDVRSGTDVGRTDGSDSVNWGVRGAINIPLIDNVLAFRVSAFDKHNAGYIDNVGLGIKDANHWEETGGRATLLWKVSDNLSIQAMALEQNVDVANMSEVTLNGTTLQPLYGPLALHTFFPEPSQQRTQDYSVTINWDVGFATLTSASGYSKLSDTTTQDFTVPYGSFVPNESDALALYKLSNDVQKFVEEVRLASPEAQILQWMVGGFFTREAGQSRQFFPVFTPQYVELPLTDDIIDSQGAADFKEKAGFVNLTYKINDMFDLSGGGRHSEYSDHGCSAQSGLFGVDSNGNPIVGCSALPTTSVWLWMADARVHFDRNIMSYARVSTGYRTGFGCPTCGNPELGIPGVVNPDKTINYEVGLKADLLNNRINLDLSIYRINWMHIQIPAVTPNGFVYTTNGGTAASSGVEIGAGARASDRLKIGTTLAYNHAYLTQTAPEASGGLTGDAMPNAPRWTSSLTLDYTIPVRDKLSMSVGGAYRYRDGVVNQFAHSGDPLPMGPQNLIDIYTGLTLQKVSLRLMGSNIFNNRSYTGLQFFNDPTAPRFVPVQPRTLTLSADYQY